MTLEALGSLRSEVVLVGGASTGLLMTDSAAAGERPTEDLDFIVNCTARGLHALEARLRDHHQFEQRPDLDDPVCRWRRGDVVIDLVPTDGSIHGFSSRWYLDAWRTAEARVVAGYPVRVISAIMFVATKLDAFGDRGQGDYQASEDLEDVIAVVDGRPELLDELTRAPSDARAYVTERIGQLLAEPRFVDAVFGHLDGDDQRMPIVMERLRSLAVLDTMAANPPTDF